MAVKVVTDSTSDMPRELAQQLGVTIIPLYVFFGNESFKDGVDITRDEFFSRLTTGGVQPRTSQPSAGDFVEIYKPLLEAGHEIVSIHISDKLSGTLNSARAALQELGEGAKVELVDSRLASVGIALVVQAAVDAANSGASLEETARVARETAENIDLYFALDTLEYLHRGGRIGKAQALVGSLLSIKPVLKLRDGEIHPHEKVRSSAKALARLREIARAGGSYEQVAFIHEASHGGAQELGKELASLSKKPVITGNIGPVIGTYTGPGTMGIALRKA